MKKKKQKNKKKITYSHAKCNLQGVDHCVHRDLIRKYSEIHQDLALCEVYKVLQQVIWSMEKIIKVAKFNCHGGRVEKEFSFYRDPHTGRDIFILGKRIILLRTPFNSRVHVRIIYKR